MTTEAVSVIRREPPTTWQVARVVGGRELRGLWLVGRGTPLVLAYTVLLSATTYLVAANRALNFLEQRESVNLTLQMAVAVGGLLVLVTAADAVSGERERDTLEGLLLAPASRVGLVIGKGLAALSLWLVTFVVSSAYLVALGRGVGIVAEALTAGLIVGVLLAVFLAGFGLLLSILSSSNRMSLAVALFCLLALFAPSQMPTSAQNGWFGNALLHIDPFTAGLQYLSSVVVDAHSLGTDAGWLVGPLVAAVVVSVAALVAAGRMTLRVGVRG